MTTSGEMPERKAMFPKQTEVLIVGNYPPDGQESMQRFARMLEAGLRAEGVPVEWVVPGTWFGRLRAGSTGMGKWLAYLDKYLIFPFVLRRKVRGLAKGGVVHVADHSNAVYVSAARSGGHRVLVTCHDLGAVRGALGEDTDCPASRMGRVLQAWIARSLGGAGGIACVSTATLGDVARLIRRKDGARVPTWLVLNGLNVPYRRLAVGSVEGREAGEFASHKVHKGGKGGEGAEGEGGKDKGASGGAEGVPFVLNVGSSLSRKNRDGVVRIFARVKEEWPEGKLVFAGEALTPEVWVLARELSVAERVVEVMKPSDRELEALYNRATCLLFPSKFEGFGWPAVEAQACGCPVLCSDAGSLGEVVGDSAFVRSAGDEEAFAGAVLRPARDEAARARWTEPGLRNAERFGAEAMVERYRGIYRELVEGKEARFKNQDSRKDQDARFKKTAEAGR